MSLVSPAPVQPELAAHTAFKLKRELHNLSRRELGRRARLSPAYVSAMEAGNIRPSFSAFSRLAVELRLTHMEIYALVRATAAHRDAEP